MIAQSLSAIPRESNAGDGLVDYWHRLPPDNVPEGLAFDDFDVVAHLTGPSCCLPIPEMVAYSIVCDEMRSAVSCVDPRRGDSVSLGRVLGMSAVAQG